MREKRLSADERKVAIALAAMPIFARKGFANTTTKDLAEAAGVSEALLYRHYPSKEALYESIQGLCCQHIEEKANNLVGLEPSTSTLVASIYLMVSGIILGHENEQENHSVLKRMMIHSMTEDGRFARQFLDARMKPWMPVFIECIHAAEKAGHMVKTPIKASSKIWLAHHLAVGVNLFTLTEEDVVDYEVSLEELVKEATFFTLRGIGLTEEAIQAHYNPEAFALMMKA